MVPTGLQHQGGATLAILSKFECSKFRDTQKTNFGILFHHKNGTYIYIYIYVTFLLMLITLWAHAYPQNVLATCCRHTCQGHGEGDKKNHHFGWTQTCDLHKSRHTPTRLDHFTTAPSPPEECVAIVLGGLGLPGTKLGLAHWSGQNYFKSALLFPGSFMPYTINYSLFRSVHGTV
jgi:hypothetical protein